MSYKYACVLWPEIVVHGGCDQRVRGGCGERGHGGAREGSCWVWLKGSCSCIGNVRVYLLSKEMEDMTLDEASVDKYAYNSMNEVQ